MFTWSWKKISNSLKGRSAPWIKGKKRPEHSKLMKVKMKEVWKNYNIATRNKQLDHLMKIGKPGRISKLHKNFKKSLISNGILGFETESYIPELKISVDELNRDKNIIIEIFGNYWHANPKIYEATDILSFNNEAASVIWEKDKSRINSLKKLGYRVIIIWEDDIRENLNLVIKKVLKIYE